MSTSNEDRTIAFQDPTTLMESDHGGAAAGVPRARMICLDTSQIEGPLPGDGQIRLAAGSEQIVGRGDTCTFTIPSRKLSRQHARIFPGMGAWGVEDLNSTNGVQVNRQKVKSAWLKDGDEVRIGPIPFRFEVDRSEGHAPGRAAAVAAAEEGAEDRTMMVGSLGASKAVIEAAQRKDEPPPPPPKTQAAAAQTAKPGGLGRLIGIALAVLVLGGLGAGGVFYYPIYQKNQEIAAVVGPATELIDRVVARSREMNTAAPSEVVLRRDVEDLEPVIVQLWQALQANPGRPDLANAYARARILAFERGFGKFFANSQVVEAGQQAAELKARLETVNLALPPAVAEKDKADLMAAIDLADLATIMVNYRGFALQYPTVTRSSPERPVPTPTVDQLNAVEQRKADFIRYRKSLNKVLRGDYRLFDAMLKEFENRDLSLVGRWREFLRTEMP